MSPVQVALLVLAAQLTLLAVFVFGTLWWTHRKRPRRMLKLEGAPGTVIPKGCLIAEDYGAFRTTKDCVIGVNGWVMAEVVVE